MNRPGALALWLPAAASLLLGVLGYFPTGRLAGEAGIRSMLIAQGLVLGAVYATMFRAMKRMAAAADAPARFKAAFRAGVERFMLTLAVAAAIAWRSKTSSNAFLIWVAISYVIMIKVETLLLIQWSRKLENR